MGNKNSVSVETVMPKTIPINALLLGKYNGTIEPNTLASIKDILNQPTAFMLLKISGSMSPPIVAKDMLNMNERRSRGEKFVNTLFISRILGLLILAFLVCKVNIIGIEINQIVAEARNRKCILFKKKRISIDTTLPTT